MQNAQNHFHILIEMQIFTYIFYYFQGYPRTNNHCEGWHNKLSRCMGTIQPNIFKFVDGILAEQKETELILSRIEAGHDPAPKRPQYDAYEKRLINIVKKFSVDVFDGSYLPYLKAIAHNSTN